MPPVAQPRFHPVDLVANPRDFGRVEHPKLAARPGLSRTERAWAMLQHRAVFVAREALATAGMGLDDLAVEVGESPNWLRRKFTGRTPANVGDLIGWASVLGVDVWPVLATSDVR